MEEPEVGTNPNVITIPTPNEEMRLLHSQWIQTRLHHFHDCSVRSMRDCIVIGRAKSLLSYLLRKTSTQSLD